MAEPAGSTRLKPPPLLRNTNIVLMFAVDMKVDISRFTRGRSTVTANGTCGTDRV